MGEDQYSTFIQRLKDSKVFKHPSQYSRFKNAIKEKRRINCVENNPLIDELEMKIGDIVFSFDWFFVTKKNFTGV